MTVGEAGESISSVVVGREGVTDGRGVVTDGIGEMLVNGTGRWRIERSVSWRVGLTGWSNCSASGTEEVGIWTA